MNDQKIIILEGEDSSGKSNIAKALSSILQIPVYRPSGQDIMMGNSPEIIKNKILEGLVLADLLKQTGISLIFDRYFPSEFVYSNALGRVFHEKELQEVDLAFSKLNTSIIICYKNNLDNYSDEIVNIKDIPKIKTWYSNFSDWTNCYHGFLNTTSQDLSIEIGGILKIIK